MATRRQRERKARKRAWESLRSRNRIRGRVRTWFVFDEAVRAEESWGAWGPEYRQQVLDERPSIVERGGVLYYWQTSGHVMRALSGQTIPSGVLTRLVLHP